MNKKPEVRNITSLIWALDPNTKELPRIVLAEASDFVKITIDMFESKKKEPKSLSKEDIKQTVVDSLLQLCEDLKKLEF